MRDHKANYKKEQWNKQWLYLLVWFRIVSAKKKTRTRSMIVNRSGNRLQRRCKVLFKWKNRNPLSGAEQRTVYSSCGIQNDMPLHFTHIEVLILIQTSFRKFTVGKPRKETYLVTSIASFLCMPLICTFVLNLLQKNIQLHISSWEVLICWA